ncbi:hypothetical protein CVV65_05375 [Kyrpidia spormannii]|uniref:Integrase n=1 Tax=Kyrpidia spormannii TaxID=2055160 RepID=A0A2K8N5U2_9BACL|nr:tyrosine-type recombinase/integrase [Kyrpidia spormannii]ATY84455.1 hypothetical protein CVV65_05375 [Kyrpidia spormannii]
MDNNLGTQVVEFLSSTQDEWQDTEGGLTVHKAISMAVNAWKAKGKAKHIDTYRRHLKDFAEFTDIALHNPRTIDKLDRTFMAKYRYFLHVRKTAKGEPLSPRTIQLHLDSLRAFFNVMKELGYVKSNPVADIDSAADRRARVAADPTEESPLTMEKLRALLSLDFQAIGGYWGLRDYALFVVLVRFMPRSSELRGLKWFHLQEDVLIIPRCKHNVEGVYRLEPDLCELLYEVQKRYGLRADEPMFISQKRCQFSETGLLKLVKKYGEIIGLPDLLPKHFRTRMGSELSREFDLVTLQNYFGHRSPDTLNRWYAKRPRHETQRVYESVSAWLPPIRLDSGTLSAR